MAIDLDPIATPDEYVERNGRVDRNHDSELEDMLTSVTRVIERRIGVAPGMLKPQSALAFKFSGDGSSRLRLRDEAGLQYFLRTITADSLKVDSDGDGSYDDYLLDTADAWVALYPMNAGAFAEPYTAIDLRGEISGATLSYWPKAERCIEITGDWGWSETPGALKERCIGIVRELIDAHHAGAAMDVYAAEEAIARTPTARSLMGMLESVYSRRLPI